MTDDKGPTKGQLLEAIDRERAEWDTFLALVGESRMLEKGAMGDWTFKDLVAHLTGWRARGLRRLEASANGQPEPEPGWPANLTTDEINDWLYEQNRDRLLGEVIAESRESFARLAEIVQMLPDEALNTPGYFTWAEGKALGPEIVSGAYFGHWHEEHEADAKRWLQQTS